MTINAGLLEQTWDHAQAHPEDYDQGAWGIRYADGTSTYDLAGLALKLLACKFVWRRRDVPVSDTLAGGVWETGDIVFSSLPVSVGKAVVMHLLALPEDRYAEYFWHSVTHDRCPIGLAARVALGIDAADALVLFEETSTLDQIRGKIEELRARARCQWERAHNAELTAAAATRPMPVKVVHP